MGAQLIGEPGVFLRLVDVHPSLEEIVTAIAQCGHGFAKIEGTLLPLGIVHPRDHVGADEGGWQRRRRRKQGARQEGGRRAERGGRLRLSEKLTAGNTTGA